MADAVDKTAAQWRAFFAPLLEGDDPLLEGLALLSCGRVLYADGCLLDALDDCSQVCVG